MSTPGGFFVRYTEALRKYLATRNESNLAVGHELGRRALRDEISMLDIVEYHFQLVDDPTEVCAVDRAEALQFLLQTLAALDVASRGFLANAERYQQQRARTEVLTHRDEFRTAVVNSLQEGFFVGTVDDGITEINESFTAITGYGANGLPYRWPFPWATAETGADERMAQLLRNGQAQYEAPIRHRNGQIVWVAVNANLVSEQNADRGAYVGTFRDISAIRAGAEREKAVARLAAAVNAATSVNERLCAMLNECRTTLDVQSVVGIYWPSDDSDPTVHTAGEPATADWNALDSVLQRALLEARRGLPLTARPVESTDHSGRARGIVAVHSMTEDAALWLEFRVPRAVSTEDQLLVAALVGHLSLGLQRARQFEAARQTSLTLQRSMLESHRPPSGFAVRYQPAVAPLEIGGDWYDVLPIDDRRIGITVGDCVGRGLPAAAVMGQLRSSVRALLLTGAEPATVLEQLDSVAALVSGALCATAFVAVLDLESATLRYSCAGHMPAVLVVPQSGVVVLTDALSVPLAVHRDEPRPNASRVLTAGSTLVCYTDGLVERHGASIDAGIARVGETVMTMMTSPVDAVADTLMSAMAPSEGYDDDVAVVVYRHPPDPLVIKTDAVAHRLRDVRHRLAAWLGAANIPTALAADIVLAVNEACENSVEHAYRGQHHGAIRVKTTSIGGQIQVQVVDNGSWKTPARRPGNRGRGLLLIRRMAGQFELDRTGAGTTVAMSFRIPAASPTSGYATKNQKSPHRKHVRLAAGSVADGTDQSKCDIDDRRGLIP